MENNERKELFAFYNVENLFSPDPTPIHRLDPTISGLRNWDERKYKNKLFKIAHVFELIRETEEVLPMLIGLAEIQGQAPLDELVTMPPFNSEYGVIHYDSMDERGVDVALLYDKRKIEIISSEPITYFFEIEDDHPANYDTTRDILHCRIKYEAEIINVFVLHLPSKREKDVNKPKREFILNDIHKKIINIISKTTEAVLICGDFNENPDDENITNLLYDSDLNKMLVNPSLELYKNKNFSTFYYKDGLLFDQILLSNNFFEENSGLKFAEAKVFNHPKLANWVGNFKGKPFRTFAGTRYLGGYSDHFPVLTQFL
mgnify:FL=1